MWVLRKTGFGNGEFQGENRGNTGWSRDLTGRRLVDQKRAARGFALSKNELIHMREKKEKCTWPATDGIEGDP